MKIKLQPGARYTVLGSGSWATAITKLLTNNIAKVGWFVREQAFADVITEQKHNPRFLSSVEFDPQSLILYTDINQAVRNSDVLIVVIPSAFVHIWLEGLTESMENKFIVSAVKGIIPEKNKTVLEYMNEKFAVQFDNMSIVTGPCHAEEIALERLSYLTFASTDQDNAKAIAQKFAADFLHTVVSADVYGTEYAAILKNIYAVAAGICHGLGYGDNFQAVLVSNAQVELAQFLAQVFPAAREAGHSAYLGDLLVTCYSQFSRNRNFGNMIGRGYRVKDAQLEMSMIAEGYYATKCMHDLNKNYKVNLPIAETMYRILYQEEDAKKEIVKLTDNLN